jgi:hypothetical protein
MKSKSLIFASLAVGIFSMLAVGCKPEDSSMQSTKATVTNLSTNSKVSAINQEVSGDALKALRAGVGCTNDVDQAVIDPDLRANDSVSKEINYGRVNDLITKTISITFDNQDDGKLHAQEKLVSVVSVQKGDLLEAPLTSTMTCDPRLPLDKACATDGAAKRQKGNTCQIFNITNSESKDFSGNLTLQNGFTAKVLKHVTTISGVVTCGQIKFGSGQIIEETVLSRDVVAVADLVACGGAPVLRTRTVVINDGKKVIQSQRSEILSAPKR